MIIKEYQQGDWACYVFDEEDPVKQGLVYIGNFTKEGRNRRAENIARESWQKHQQTYLKW